MTDRVDDCPVCAGPKNERAELCHDCRVLVKAHLYYLAPHPARTCPSCGGRKSYESELCSTCAKASPEELAERHRKSSRESYARNRWKHLEPCPAGCGNDKLKVSRYCRGCSSARTFRRWRSTLD